MKKRKKIPDSKRFSILTNDLHRCVECDATVGLHLHEIFFGRVKRDLSKEYGLVIPLCLEHHEGTNGIHGKNGHALDMKWKARGQAAFEKHYPDLDFIKIFGKGGYK